MKFDTTPTDDLLTAQQMHEALPNAGEYYGTCDPIETFLSVNAADIPAQDRATLREMAAKYIKGEDTINLDACPEHLRDAMRRIVIQAA